MAAQPDPETEEGRKTLISQIEPDLHGLLERKEVPAVVQAGCLGRAAKALAFLVPSQTTGHR